MMEWVNLNFPNAGTITLGNLQKEIQEWMEQNLNDEDVLNGIAYDAATDRLFVTGKYWAKVYEINLIPQ